jgi:signal transduction histidine kinase
MVTFTPLFVRFSKSVAAPYVLALLATVVALSIRLALNPFLGDYVFYVSLFPAIAFCALFCGVGPSILSVALCLVGSKSWLIPRLQPLRLTPPSRSIEILGFFVACGVVVMMGEVLRRQIEDVRREQETLENRVRERTTEIDRVNQNLRELSARLLRLQDEERRRFARELHDSVGQTLVGLAMNLSSVRADIERLAKTVDALGESEALVQEMSKEVRTISYLLHPPLLDEAGLTSALRWYLEGFTQRSKIQVESDFPDDFGRLSQELETAIFRVVQECLTNIHRHSGSPTAKVRIARSNGFVFVEVSDSGRGIAPEKRLEMEASGVVGVGVRGMRERIRQLGGSLELDSNGRGTMVRLRLPAEYTSAIAPVS